MHVRQFDLNLLVALDALLTECSVTRAGLRTHVSQSAMRGQLARLRGFFNDHLLVPVGRRMLLTPLAQDLAEPVKDVLAQIQSTLRAVNLTGLDLNLLVALDTLLAEKNVTNAGRQLNLTQPAMSGALARLRELLHDPLLVHVGQRMVLTPLGEHLVEPVRDLLLRVERTIVTRPRFHPSLSDRRLSIAASDYATSVLLVDLLRHIETAAPNITFEFRAISKRTVHDLRGGYLDFLIAPGVIDETLSSEPLFEDRFACIAWTHNRRIAETITLEEYLSLGHVVIRFDGDGEIRAERELRRLHYERTIEVITPAFDLAPQLVVGTNRIATVPMLLARKYAESLPIRMLPLPVDIPPLYERLHWHSVHDQDPVHRWLRTQ